MKDITQKEILIRYKQIFEEAYKNEGLKMSLHDNGVNIGFAAPLKTDGGDMAKDILFVGINPSFNDDDRKRPLFNASSTGAENDYLSFEYGLDKHDANHIYYGKIVKLATESGFNLTKCGYLDLFVYRRQNQDQLRKILVSKPGLDFIISQIEVFHDIVMHAVKPKLIVVLNAQVRSFLGLHIRHFKGKAEPENIWLGLRTTPTDMNMIHQITGIAPKLSEDFNKRVEGSKPENEMYILPYRYLRYVSKEDINELALALQEFKSKHLS